MSTTLKKRFSRPLYYTKLDGDWREVDSEFYQVISDTEMVVIPKGFTTDLASIPKWARWIYPPSHNDYAQAAVVHDWLCEKRHVVDTRTLAVSRKKVGRFEAGRIFYDGMKLSGAPWHKRWVIYTAVTLNDARIVIKEAV